MDLWRSGSAAVRCACMPDDRQQLQATPSATGQASPAAAAVVWAITLICASEIGFHHPSYQSRQYESRLLWAAAAATTNLQATAGQISAFELRRAALLGRDLILSSHLLSQGFDLDAMAHVDAAAAAAHARGNRIAEVIVFFALVVVSARTETAGTAARKGSGVTLRWVPRRRSAAYPTQDSLC